jgi:metallothionein
MATVESGTALTCGHEGCGCQVRIDEVCNCAGGGDSYTCICGATLVAKTGAAPISGGAVLTCGHEGCHCAVRIEAGCNCSGQRDNYICICGAPLVAKAA